LKKAILEKTGSFEEAERQAASKLPNPSEVGQIVCYLTGTGRITLQG
jgi:hypothetical protein